VFKERWSFINLRSNRPIVNWSERIIPACCLFILWVKMTLVDTKVKVQY
jgi:hypothetical protein